jgi:hypothetical protein
MGSINMLQRCINAIHPLFTLYISDRERDCSINKLFLQSQIKNILFH